MPSNQYASPKPKVPNRGKRGVWLEVQPAGDALPPIPCLILVRLTRHRPSPPRKLLAPSSVPGYPTQNKWLIYALTSLNFVVYLHTSKIAVYKSFICHTSETPTPLLRFTSPFNAGVGSPPPRQVISRRAPYLLRVLREQHLQDVLQAFILKYLRARQII